MTQNVTNNRPPSRYGTINRVGMTPDGRVVYQAISANGENGGKISIAQKDCDLFEKSYRDILETAPAIERYTRTTSPDELAKKQKRAKWIVGLSTAIGGGIPLFAIKTKANFWGALLQIGATVGGCVAGLVGGSLLAESVVLPPGSKKYAQATKNLSKIDARPVA